MRSPTESEPGQALAKTLGRMATVALCDDILRWLDQTLYLRDSPYGNRFKSAVSPWLHEPSRALTGPNGREGWIMTSVAKASVWLRTSPTGIAAPKTEPHVVRDVREHARLDFLWNLRERTELPRPPPSLGLSFFLGRHQERGWQGGNNQPGSL